MAFDALFFYTTSAFSIHSLTSSKSLIDLLLWKQLIVLSLFASTYWAIGMTIYFIQMLLIIINNTVILESKEFLGWEYFILQNSFRNPYSRGYTGNIYERISERSKVEWPLLTPGPVTDAYCADMKTYRGVDLSPYVLEITMTHKKNEDIET
jgi:hypothetical protein